MSLQCLSRNKYVRRVNKYQERAKRGVMSYFYMTFHAYRMTHGRQVYESDN